MEKRQLNTGDRITTASLREEDAVSEPKLRPMTLDTYIGQEKVKENMRIYMQAAKQRGECLDHVLLYGPPGLGKTTLSNIIANEMNANIKVTSGPAIGRPGDMAAILNGLNEGLCLCAVPVSAAALGKVSGVKAKQSGEKVKVTLCRNVFSLYRTDLTQI